MRNTSKNREKTIHRILHILASSRLLAGLQLRTLLLHDVRQTRTKHDLARRQVLRFECDLPRAVRAFPYFPDTRLQLIARLDGRSEADTEELDGVGIAATDGLEDGASSETERGETMEDNTTEACCFADAGV